VATNYLRNDVVTEGGSSYVARNDTLGFDPAVVVDVPGSDWALFVAKGATGATGPTGLPGSGAVVVDIAPGGVCGTRSGARITDGFGMTSVVCDGATGATGPTGPAGPTGPGGVVSSAAFLPNLAIAGSPSCSAHTSQQIIVPATAKGGLLVITGWMRVVVGHTVGTRDRGFVYVSPTNGDCGVLPAADASRSYWRVAATEPTDAGYEITVPIHQSFGVGVGGGTFLFFTNVQKEAGAAGTTIDSAANIDVRFIPS